MQLSAGKKCRRLICLAALEFVSSLGSPSYGQDSDGFFAGLDMYELQTSDTGKTSALIYPSKAWSTSQELEPSIDFALMLVCFKEDPMFFGLFTYEDLPPIENTKGYFEFGKRTLSFEKMVSQMSGRALIFDPKDLSTIVLGDSLKEEAKAHFDWAGSPVQLVFTENLMADAVEALRPTCLLSIH